MNTPLESPIRLSIIIPVYNRQQGLINLLNSLMEEKNLSQLKETEIIIIDDGTKNPINLPRLNLPLRLYRLEKNAGAPRARDYGYQQSIGQFIHFHDSDDTFGEGWLSQVFNVLESTPAVDILLTARYDDNGKERKFRYQKYFHRHSKNKRKIRQRLVYRNCMGPLGGVIFSRRSLTDIPFLNFASCQDWQMYLGAIGKAKLLLSCPDIVFYFNTSGRDRISHNSRKKIRGHLQLSRITQKQSIFKKEIRLYYLITCYRHIQNNGGKMLGFYKRHRTKMWFYYILVSIYWRYV